MYSATLQWFQSKTKEVFGNTVTFRERKFLDKENGCVQAYIGDMHVASWFVKCHTRPDGKYNPCVADTIGFTDDYLVL